MKFLLIAIALLFTVALGFSVPTATCTHDLEVLCIDDINKGIQHVLCSLPHLRPGRQGKGKGRPRRPGMHEVHRYHRQGLLAMHLRSCHCPALEHQGLQLIAKFDRFN